MANHIDEVFYSALPDFSKIIYVSPGYEKIFGQTPEHLYKRAESWLDVVHKDDLERVVNVIQEGLGKGLTVSFTKSDKFA